MWKNAIWPSGGVVLVLLLVVVTGQGSYAKLGWMDSPFLIVDIHGAFSPSHVSFLRGDMYIKYHMGCITPICLEMSLRQIRYIMRIQGLTLKVGDTFGISVEMAFI